jgi:DNA processing protein
MITAELANGYNKDVFAIPGKLTDNKSAGCNHLIKNNKAALLATAEELLLMMGWQQKKKKDDSKKQRQLFIELTADEKIIFDILKEKDSAHIDEINFRSALSSHTVASAILSLELQNVIVSLPGKIYKLN